MEPEVSVVVLVLCPLKDVPKVNFSAQKEVGNLKPRKSHGVQVLHLKFKIVH